MNEERHEEIMTAISNLSAQFSEMLREFKKRGELLHEADDATLSTNDFPIHLGQSSGLSLQRSCQRNHDGSHHFQGTLKNGRSAAIAGLPGDDSFALHHSQYPWEPSRIPIKGG